MRLVFIGVGEAFDPLLPNTSLLFEAGKGSKPVSLLLDCGYTVPSSYWRLASDPLGLTGVWLSHFHGDHFLGLSQLLLRFAEEGRNAPLTIIGQPQTQSMVEQSLDLAYPRLRGRMPFPLHYLAAEPGNHLDWMGLGLDCAPSEHTQTNYALRVVHQETSFLYSGDGRPTPASTALAQGVDLLVHESFSLEPDTPGHGTVPGTLALARETGARAVALVHLRRDIRHQREREVADLLQAQRDLHPLLPMPGTVL